MKVCSNCNIEKEDSEFRTRVDKRIGKECIYLNNTCKDCDKILAKKHYAKKMANPENRKKHNQWANEYHKRHRDKAIEYNRKRRKTPEYKAYIKEYRAKRKEKIYQQEVITKRRYHEKNRDKVTDKYVVNLLRTQGYGVPYELIKNKDLIEIKRGEILLSRIKEKVRKAKIKI